MNRALLWETIKVLESCEAKLEYMGQHRMGTRDAYDCLHRAAKARDIISSLQSMMDETARHVPSTGDWETR